MCDSGGKKVCFGFVLALVCLCFRQFDPFLLFVCVTQRLLMLDVGKGCNEGAVSDTRSILSRALSSEVIGFAPGTR